MNEENLHHIKYRLTCRNVYFVSDGGVMVEFCRFKITIAADGCSINHFTVPHTTSNR